MADHLASIFGTEKDRVNCPFYFKIGCVTQASIVVHANQRDRVRFIFIVSE